MDTQGGRHSCHGDRGIDGDWAPRGDRRVAPPGGIVARVMVSIVAVLAARGESPFAAPIASTSDKIAARAGAARSEATASPSAIEILRRSEDVRAPAIDYTADFTIVIHEPTLPAGERRTSYSMIAHGKDSTLAVMRTPEMLRGGTLLIDKGSYWLLLPRVVKPLQLSPAQILLGDVSNGDLARANLLDSYEPRLDGEEALDETPCWSLDLTRTRAAASYPRIRLWVAKKDFLPMKLELYGMSGDVLRTARYRDYRVGPIGLRATTIEFADMTGARGRSRMVFSNFQRIDASAVDFTPQGMGRFRDAVLSGAAAAADGAATVDWKRVLAALAAAHR